MSSRRYWNLLAFIGVLGVVSRAGAAGIPAASGDVTLARQLSDAGLNQFRRGDYNGALDSFTRSYDLVPQAALLFDIAQAHRKKGDCQAALDHYRRFMRVVDPVTASQAQVSVHIEQMEACVRSGPATDQGGLTDQGWSEATEAVAPSVHLTTVASPPEQGPVNVQCRPAPVQLSASLVEQSSGRPLKITGVIIEAVGVVALAGAIAAGLRASALSDRVSNAFDRGGQSTPALEQLVSQGRTYQTASEVLYAGGATALLTGAALYYWGARRRGRLHDVHAAVTGLKDGVLVSVAFSQL